MTNEFTAIDDGALEQGATAGTVVLEKSDAQASVPATLVEAIDRLDVEVARRVHAEESLREIEQRFRHLSEHAGKFLWLSDPATNELLYISPGYEEVWARTREMAFGSAAEWTGSFRKRGPRSCETNENDKVYTVAGPDGSPRWIRDRMFPIRDDAGQIIRIMGVAEDITDAKRLHNELVTLKARLQALYAAVPDLVFRVRRDGTILDFKASADTSLLIPEAQLVGKNLKHLLPTQLASEAMQQVALALRTRELQTMTCQYLLPDELRDFEARGIACADDEVLAVVRDVSDHKRLEREILEVGSREQQRIGQDLHDGLGQHLTGITFLTKALERRLTAKHMEEAQEAAEIGRLVLQALVQTRNLARGLVPAELERNGLCAALADLAATVEHTCNVHCTFSNDASVSVSDNLLATHVFRIAQEAINNSVKHGKAKNITVALRSADDKIQLRITDDGTGFSPEAATEGLGLRIMNYRARRLGGSLEVTTPERGGACITCTFGKKYESN